MHTETKRKEHTLAEHDCHRLSIAQVLAPGSYKQEIRHYRVQMG